MSNFQVWKTRRALDADLTCLRLLGHGQNRLSHKMDFSLVCES